MLKFPGLALPVSLEQLLRAIRQSPGQAVQVPSQLKLGGGLGGAVGVVQALATWARLHPGGRELRMLSGALGTEAAHERFASTLHGMAALYFAESILLGDRRFGRYEALGPVKERVEAMQKGRFQDTLRGVGVGLICFAGAKNEFLLPLYERPKLGHVRSYSDFRLLVPRMLAGAGPGLIERLSDGQLDLLSALVHQLFLNTDQHGVLDLEGEAYEPALRGVMVRLTSLEDRTALSEQAHGDAALRTFLTKLPVLSLNQRDAGKVAGAARGPRDDRRQVERIVEITIFDTGPGMALRWLADRQGYRRYEDFDEREELEAINACFEKHATTKAASASGLGLTMATMAMKGLNAFMTLRTGRTALYQDFSAGATDSFKPKPRYPKGARLAEVAGTAYSIWFKVS